MRVLKKPTQPIDSSKPESGNKRVRLTKRRCQIEKATTSPAPCVRSAITWQIQHHHEKAIPYFRQVLSLEGVDAEHISGAWLRLGYSLRLLNKGEVDHSASP